MAAPAFTLVELLAVAAVLAVFAGTLGVALRHSSEAPALQAGQLTVASLCGATRLDAVLAGGNARLVVAADPVDAVCYLRYLQVVREDPVHPGCWLAEGGGAYLADGIFIVPPPAATVPGNSDWPATRRSTALPATAQALTINGTAAGLHYFVQFSARGTTGGGNLVLTGGRRAGDNRLVFDDSDNVRGLLLRPSGAFTFLNDAGDLTP